MKVVIVGLGVQGRKRLAVAGADVVATVDPVVPDATFRRLEDVPGDSFDAACVCTPDSSKLELVRSLLARGKHVLVEKPLHLEESAFADLSALARSTGSVCYTAYNHRFEPHLARLREIVRSGRLGELYLARFFYGNGTARDVRNSPWRDTGPGVLVDLGSHLLDLALFLFDDLPVECELWSANRFENRAFDHVIFGVNGRPVLEFEATLIAWRNAFYVELFGSSGSAHVNGLCKWGPSTLTVRTRVLPSGRPSEEVDTIDCTDPTWQAEYAHFQALCAAGVGNVDNDRRIGAVLHRLGAQCATLT